MVLQVLLVDLVVEVLRMLELLKHQEEQIKDMVVDMILLHLDLKLVAVAAVLVL